MKQSSEQLAMTQGEAAPARAPAGVPVAAPIAALAGHVLSRRAALGFGVSALALAGGLPGARAQTVSLDLQPMPLPVKQDDTVAAGYARNVLLRWGDRVAYDAPNWDPNHPTPAAAATQFGWDARLAALCNSPPAADGIPRAVLAVSHPTVSAAMAFPDAQDHPHIASGMQGASLVNVEFQQGRWIVVDGGYQSRRLTADTLCAMDGPAADAAGGSVQGVLGLAGGSATPWGGLLLCEDDVADWLTRLGPLDQRFRSGRSFGWMVELDPQNPQSVPVKHTALGRFPHGDAAAALTKDGRAVVYMTDHRPTGYLFRFISSAPAGVGIGALGAGTLYVAQTGGSPDTGAMITWLALPQTSTAMMDPITAAAQLGATPFDTPSGLAIDGRGYVYLACNGNAGRGGAELDALNPRAGSPSGQVIEIIPTAGDHAANTAAGNILFLAGDPNVPGSGARYGGTPFTTTTAWPDQPDTLTVDGRGRLWIGTNHRGRVGPQADGLYSCDLQGPGRGLPLPLYGAPRAAAVGGAASTPDGISLLVVVRHPGAEPGATFSRPGTRWTSFDPGVPPRSALIGFTRQRGGVIGG